MMYYFFYKQLLLINTYLICESNLNSDFGKANNANIYYVIDPLVYHTSQVIIYFLITKIYLKFPLHGSQHIYKLHLLKNFFY